MTLTVDNLSTRRKNPSVTLSTANVTWIEWGSNPGCDDYLAHDIALTRMRLKLICTVYKRSSSYLTENPLFISYRLVFFLLFFYYFFFFIIY